MTDNEIIKGFEDFINRLCGDISSLSVADRILLQDAFRLMLRQKTEIDKKDTEIDILIRKKESLMDEISELKAEIERLQTEKRVLNIAMSKQNYLMTNLQKVVKRIVKKFNMTTRAEAIKEFEKLVARRLNCNTPRGAYLLNIMNEVKKEMTE